MADGVRSLTEVAEDAVGDAMRRVLPAELAGSDPLVRRSEHADFQSNVALALAKRAGHKPRELAEALAGALRDGQAGADLGVELSGPGFLNLTVPDRAVWSQVAERLADDRLGVGSPLADRRTVVDYSGPNIAKEMHVGHLRTTIIGDALAKLLEHLGSEVIRQNHLGDWGTQFGMLIQYLDEHPDAAWRADELTGDGVGSVSALDGLYRAARALFDADTEFAERARARVVALQSGDPATLALWRELVAESERAFQAIYDHLGVSLTPADSAGESTYNDSLDEVVDELERAGVAEISEGALCVFFDDVTGPDGSRVPLIVRKSDGGYGYATTDLATIRHRLRDLKANWILYVVDARQSLHFQMVFGAAARMGWLGDDQHAVHVRFGSVLGPDGKPFKTRSGGTVRLTELLDSAVERACGEIESKPHELSEAELALVAQQAGIGAVKYADLSTSRTKDYIFDVDRMVSLHGNTGVYLQYAHTRIQSILRRLPETAAAGDASGVSVALELHPAERALGLLVDQFGATLAEAAETFEPHRLCGYLFALAKAFTDFYEACPVLRAPTQASRLNRVALCQLTGRTLAEGLRLLGIETPVRM